MFCADSDLDGKAGALEKLLLEKGAPKQSVEGLMQMVRGMAAGMTAEQQLSWAQRQTYIALATALYAAKSLGFDACPMEGFDASEFAKVLSLPDNLVPTALCPIGYATGTPRPKVRFEKSELFF